MRVLFVDDQADVLAGLRRVLRGLRDEWDMTFSESGENALALMEDSSYDVVVSDMRMPGMDGAQLLTEIMKRHPATVRIILSGQADQTSVMRAVTPAHQYLSKPCDTETLRTTVSRAFALRRTLSDESLIRLISQVTTLPSLPTVYASLMEELQSEDASVQSVANLISRDIGMTAKLMQMVNSSFFGIPRRVESPTHAAALLGLNVLKPLVLSAGIFSQFPDSESAGYSVNALMDHSLAVSRLAQRIAKDFSDNHELAEDSLIAGLLHDVGQILLVSLLKDEYRAVLKLAREKEITLYDAETESLGASHADAGAYLLGLWGMADPIVEAVAYHHCPRRCLAGEFGPLTAVHVANVLANEAHDQSKFPLSVEMDVPYLERLAVADQLPNWRQRALEFQGAGV